MRAVFFIFLLIFSLESLADPFTQKLVSAAIERTHHKIRYDGRYFSISYPNGDVPAHLGVCTDVVIRSYRKLGIDLQKLLHDDIKANFDLYPSKKIWGLNKPDPNIDHRRVPNLQVFFSRHGRKIPVTTRPRDYKPGDLVTWMLPGNLPHIGIITDKHDILSGEPLVVHNIGNGPALEQMLFRYEITGHYRYSPG